MLLWESLKTFFFFLHTVLEKWLNFLPRLIQLSQRHQQQGNVSVFILILPKCARGLIHIHLTLLA